MLSHLKAVPLPPEGLTGHITWAVLQWLEAALRQRVRRRPIIIGLPTPGDPDLPLIYHGQDFALGQHRSYFGSKTLIPAQPDPASAAGTFAFCPPTINSTEHIN